MKKILFVRHAQSSWADIKLDDKQRPLNKRGKRDAPLMAARCVEYGLKVQLLISSPAVRAFATCLVFQDIYNLHTPIQVENHLFHGDASNFEDALCGVNDNIDCVAIFGHNPGITYLANELDSKIYIDNVPTAGVVIGEIDIEHWEDFSVAKTVLKDLLYPKMLYNSDQLNRFSFSKFSVS